MAALRGDLILLWALGHAEVDKNPGGEVVFPSVNDDVLSGRPGGLHYLGLDNIAHRLADVLVDEVVDCRLVGEAVTNLDEGREKGAKRVRRHFSCWRGRDPRAVAATTSCVPYDDDCGANRSGGERYGRNVAPGETHWG